MRKANKRVSKRTCPSGGKKRVVEAQVQEILGEREARYGTKGEVRRAKLIQALKPVRETKTVKRSGMAQPVPKRVSESRGKARAARWLVDAAKKRAKKRGCTRKDGRRRELGRAYEEVRAREKGESGRKLQSEPFQIRDRRHKAAKANRVNVS
jgi:ribosomal protein S7